jgi:hypothetical protein
MNASLTGFPGSRTPDQDWIARILPGVTDKAQRSALLHLWRRIIVRHVVFVNGHPDTAANRF